MASVFRSFEGGDLSQTVVRAQPLLTAVQRSSSDGMRWSVNYSRYQGPLGAVSPPPLSTYGGVRERIDVGLSDYSTGGIAIFPLVLVDTHSIDRIIAETGSYPVYSPFTIKQIDPTMGPLPLLYDFYSSINDSYFTGSYDYYSLLLNTFDTPGTGSFVVFGTSHSASLPSFTLEMMVKPIRTGSLQLLQGVTVDASASVVVATAIDSHGHLCMIQASSSIGPVSPQTIFSSSSPLSFAEWQHVACSVGGGTASLYVDGVQVGTSSFVSPSANAHSASFQIGGLVTASVGGHGPYAYAADAFVFDARFWSSARSRLQISSSMGGTLFASASSDLLAYYRMNDGPLSRWMVSPGLGDAENVPGWSITDSGAHGSHAAILTTSGPANPYWWPNDDQDFLTPKTRIIPGPVPLSVLDISQNFYGRQITTGSFEHSLNIYSQVGIKVRIVDDGRGSLYVSGSLTEPLSNENYAGVTWRKVGEIFYSEGIISYSDPAIIALLDLDGFYKPYPASEDLVDVSSISFRGDVRITSKTFDCRLGTAEGNASNNPTYSREISSDNLGHVIETVRPDRTTYVTGVGLYNEERKLVATARLAQPIRKRETDKLDIRLSIDI